MGIDGSNAAIHTALWAVDEAISRDIPLRLLAAVDPGDEHKPDANAAARRLASAEIAIRYAVTAIESTEKPVKIEVEITQGHPVSSLLRSSRSAAMVCVGAVGLRHFQPDKVGSTAAALATKAHCPVAIVRADDGPNHRDKQWIVVGADDTPDTGVLLEAAVEEARLRDAPLRAITCWRPPSGDDRQDQTVTDGNRRVQADLQRRLARWTQRYPGLRVETEAVGGNILDYLKKNGHWIQLVVVSARAGHHIGELIGPAGNAVLHDTHCSVLVVDHQHL